MLQDLNVERSIQVAVSKLELEIAQLKLELKEIRKHIKFNE